MHWVALLVLFWDFGFGFFGSKPPLFWIGSSMLEYPVAFLPFYIFFWHTPWLGGLAWQATAFFVGVGLCPPFLLLELPPEAGWLVRPVYTAFCCERGGEKRSVYFMVVWFSRVVGACWVLVYYLVCTYTQD